MAPDLKNGELTIGSGWLVGWFVNLSKWAKNAISELIWLKFRIDVPNGPRFTKMLFRLKEVVG